jgi:hypothetical protein
VAWVRSAAQHLPTTPYPLTPAPPGEGYRMTFQFL